VEGMDIFRYCLLLIITKNRKFTHCKNLTAIFKQSLIADLLAADFAENAVSQAQVYQSGQSISSLSFSDFSLNNIKVPRDT
jgi:hypothetical protein